MCVCVCVCVIEGGLNNLLFKKTIDWQIYIMTSYLLLKVALTIGIQANLYQVKKGVNCRGNFVEKWIPFGHISWAYLIHSINF